MVATVGEGVHRSQCSKSGLHLQGDERCASCGRWVSFPFAENCICESLLKAEEDEQAMDSIIDQEVREGWAHFRCDVCEIDYDMNEKYADWLEMRVMQGTYHEVLYEVCNMCAEEILNEYV